MRRCSTDRNQTLPTLQTLGKLCLALCALVILPSCNFFGKQTDPVSSNVIGQIGNGKVILGTWSFSYSNLSETNTPATAYTDSITFDPNGSFRIETRDLHAATGWTCTAYGAYRAVGEKDLVLYTQAASSSACGFASQMHFTGVDVIGNVLTFSDADHGGSFVYFADYAPQTTAVVGVWNFNGAGGAVDPATGKPFLGYDVVLFDAHGYFRIQSTDVDGPFHVIGLYAIDSSKPVPTLTLYFFDGKLPPGVADTREFVQFVTDGSSLVLVHLDEQGNEVSWSGTRL